MLPRLWAFAVISAVWPLMGDGVAHAQAVKPELAEGLHDLFEVGWQKTYSAREAATERYGKLKAAAPSDARVAKAYLLVLLRQARYPEALKQADEVLRFDKQDRMTWEIKAWLAAILKEYDAAMAHMGRVAELLPEQEVAGDAERQCRDAVALLGRLCGFFETAVKDGADGAALDTCRDRIVARLTTARRQVFDEARRGVVRDFAGAVDEAATTTEVNEADAAKKKEQVTEDLKKKAVDAYAQVEAAQEAEKQARMTFDYEISKIASAEADLTSRAQRIEMDGARVREAIRSADLRVADSAARADNEKDPGARQYWLNEMTRWQMERSRNAGALATLDRQYAGLKVENVGLKRKRAETESRYQQEVGRIDAAVKAYDRTRAQLGRAEGQPVTGVNALVRDQKRRAVALTSYVPLPISLDGVRDKLMESVK